MKINPINEPGQSRTGYLMNITKKEIEKIIGFEPNVKDDPIKVKYSWGFEIDSKQFGIWDYCGSSDYNEFSTYGDHDVLYKLFSGRYQRSDMGNGY
jgi:hypothetical protein